jgi:hypothetical protein
LVYREGAENSASARGIGAVRQPPSIVALNRLHEARADAFGETVGLGHDLDFFKTCEDRSQHGCLQLQ